MQGEKIAGGQISKLIENHQRPKAKPSPFLPSNEYQGDLTGSVIQCTTQSRKRHMSKIYKWEERKFNFYLTAEMYMPAVERVRGTPARVEDAISVFPGELLTKKKSEDVWSIQENIGHLLSLEPLWAERLDQFMERLPELKAWDETNRSTCEADYNSKPIDVILGEFKDTRKQLVDRLDALDDSLVEQTALHPRLKTPMRTIDLVYFVSEHDDYHLAQITRLKREL